MILVSACLAGLHCRHDGDTRRDKEIVKMCAAGEALPLCPEVLGGLKIPHPPAEIRNGDGRDVLEGRAVLIDAEQKDVTRFFIEGAKMTLRACQHLSITKAILKSKSPSCGCGLIYNDGKLVKGDGVTTALMKIHGFEIETR
ncbi:MAG: DUF523 domain-containing protein [Thermoplasmata archaeon]|nr:DUF523 domain-containing protein [Thermoplasmata archaeon]